MKHDNLSKKELISKIAKLELDLIKANSKNKKLEKSEDTVTQQSSILKFLKSIAIPSADKSSVNEFSKILLKVVKEYTGAVLATFSLYRADKKELLLLHVEAEQGILKAILKIAGEKIVDTASPVDDETYKLIIKNQVGTFNTFTEVTFGAIPKLIDRAIRASTGIDRLYPVAHVIEGELYGTTMLAFKKGQTSPSIELLESFAHLMSVSLRRYNAEKALQDSEIKYRTYIGHAPLGIIIANDKGKYIDVNPGASELLGYTQDELIKLSIPDILAHEKDLDSFHKLKEEGKLNYELKLKKKDGTVINVRLDAVLLPNNQLIAFHTDITEHKKAEEALKESEGKYKNLFNSMQEGVYLHQMVYDDFGNAINYRIIEANDISEKILNIKKEDAIGQLATDLYETKEAPFLEIYSKVAATGEPHMFDQYFEPINKHFSISAFSPKKGEFATAFTDITKQKKDEQELTKAKEKVEKSELRFKAISEHAMDGIALTDLEGRYVFVNHAFCEMMGFSQQELLKLKVFDLRVEDSENNLFHRIKEDRKKGKTARTKLMRKDKSIIFVDINGSFLDLGKEQYILGIHRDVTELVNRENELIEAKEKAEESDRLKSAFLANMSHEIRTPMNGILGFTNLLKEPGLTGKQQKEYIKIIQKSGDRMLNTVNDIIEISRIETGQIKLSSNKVDISDHLVTLYNFFKLEADDKGLSLILNNKLTKNESLIETDKSKFGSIITNLVKNAIKFTDKGSIKIGCEKNGEFLEFYIKDTGIGIPSARKEAIFNRFEQADITDSGAYQGSGLGLSITKTYVEMLGGKIGMESEEGVGSQFYFTIPYKTNSNEIREKNTEDSNKSLSIKKGLKVLIVEDDEFSITYLNVILNDYAKKMLIAKTGIEAVELCRDNPDIDIVLMDIKIPGINGYEATQQIREFNKEVFILAQTAYAQVGDSEKAIKAGCNEYISKPIDKEKLLQIIASHLHSL